MRPLPTMIAASAAAVLTALAVTVSAPATGGGGDAEADAFVTCLRAQGLDGAPSGRMALKTWLGERLDRRDDAVEDAMSACAPPKGAAEKRKGSPTDEQLLSCLEEHGARIEGDGRSDVKRWVATHEDDASARGAMKACSLALPGSKRAPGGCDDKAVAEPASARESADN